MKGICPNCEKQVKDRNDGCDWCKLFFCEGCQKWRSWSRGAADNRPELCDDCWALEERGIKDTKIVFDMKSAGLKKLSELPVGAFFVQGSIGNEPNLYQLIEECALSDHRHMVMNQTKKEKQFWDQDKDKMCAQVEVTITVHGYSDLRVCKPFGD